MRCQTWAHSVVGVLTAVWSSLVAPSSIPGELMRCNSLPELCSLRFNQVSFAGSHNAGSGFDGDLRRCNGVVQDSCIWRNQNLNITEQLELGIRFLEIDLCVLPDMCNYSVYDNTGDYSLFTCRYGIGSNLGKVRYAGPIFKLFQQIDDWMVKNPNEVIGLYFPNNSPLGGNATDVFFKLQTLLEDFWQCEGTEFSVCMSTYYSTSGEWPRLADAIATKQRIFVFLAPELIGTSNAQWNHLSFHSTYIKPPGEINLCNDRLNASASQCDAMEDILIKVGVTSGICIENGQDNCNRELYNATELCYYKRALNQKTVNVVAVDFPDLPSTTVFNITDMLNKLNIVRYSPPTTTDFITLATPNTTPTGNCKVNFSSLYIITVAVLFVYHVAL